MSRHAYREGALHFEDGAIVMKLCADHGLPLSYEALHAVCVHHGGWSPLAQTNFKLEITTLGVLLHAADLLSAKCQRGDVDWIPDGEAKTATVLADTPAGTTPLPLTSAVAQELVTAKETPAASEQPPVGSAAGTIRRPPPPPQRR